MSAVVCPHWLNHPASFTLKLVQSIFIRLSNLRSGFEMSLSKGASNDLKREQCLVFLREMKQAGMLEDLVNAVRNEFPVCASAGSMTDAAKRRLSWWDSLAGLWVSPRSLCCQRKKPAQIPCMWCRKAWHRVFASMWACMRLNCQRASPPSMSGAEPFVTCLRFCAWRIVNWWLVRILEIVRWQNI